MLKNVGLRKSVEQPVLDLNFAASQIGSNGAPDSRIDFSRGTNAWFVDSDGLVKKSPHNLLTYSLFNADVPTNWTVAFSTGAFDHTLQPATGILSRFEKQIFHEQTTSGRSYISQNFTPVAGLQYKARCFFNPDETNHLSGSTAIFAITGTGITGTLSATKDDIDPDTGEVSLDFVSSSGSFVQIRIGVGCFGSATGSAVFAGPQLSQHTTLPVDNPYLKTTSSAVYAARLDHDPSWFMSAAQEQNLEAHSEDLTSAEEFLVRATVTDNDTTAPDGTTTADKLVVDGTASDDHYIRFSYEALPSTAVTFSLHARADELSEFGIKTFGSLGFENSVASTFNLSAGTVSKHANHTNATIEALDDGWFRVSVTENTDSDIETRTIQVQLMSGGSADFDGDSTSGMHFWGLQFEVGTSPSTYHRTEGAPYYGPGATPRGLLIEEARTNLITESEDFGTTWTMTGLTVDTDEVLAPDGTTSADFIEETTATSVHEIRMQFLVTQATSKHVLSCFVKAQDRTILRIAGSAFSAWATGGTWPNAFFDLSTETVTLSSGHSAGIEDYGNGWYRCHVVGTSGSSPTGAGISVSTIKSGTTTSYTGEAGKGLYVWGAQLEKGDFLTSYTQTTGASATRNADVATMGPTTGGTELVTNGTFDTDSDWVDDDQGTGSSSISGGKLVLSGSSFDNRAMRYQQRTVVDGRRYRLTFDKSDDQMVLRVGTSLQGDELVSATFSNPAGGDESFSYDFTADGTVAFVRFIHQNTGASPSGTSRVDNVSLRELYPFEQYNPAEGTFQLGIEIDSHDMAGAINPIFSIGPSAAIIDQNNSYDVAYVWVWSGDNNNLYFRSFDSSETLVANFTLDSEAGQPYAPGRTKVVAFCIKEDDYVGVGNKSGVDGLFRRTDGDVSIAKVDSMRLSVLRTDFKFPNVHWKFVRYYPHRVSNATLKSLIRDYDDT